MSVYAHPTSRPIPAALDVGEHRLEFDHRFHVMGVVNVTPDSFSDGGAYLEAADAVDRAMSMVDAGADLVDIGGESTRPGAPPVGVGAECDRVVPVIEALAGRLGVPMSIDTSKARVARAGLDAGATMVNDVTGLRGDPDMAAVVADAAAAVVVMHMRGTPETMQSDLAYDDVTGQVRDYLLGSVNLARRAGIGADKIVVDPGIGFGKSVAQNYRLLRHLYRFFDLQCPILVGTSRKSCIGEIIDKPADQRVWGTAATVACGLYAGANIVRVHDVAQMHDVVRITEAIAADNGPPANGPASRR